MFQAYVGRDYLNIRYDDIIFTVRAGLTFSLDKYLPSGWRPDERRLETIKTDERLQK
jgi:hypothetical protein